MKSNMTNHARHDRRNRFDYILDTVGLGTEIVAEVKRLDDKNRVAYSRLTDSGIIVIVSADHKTVVTAYIATIEQASAIYRTARGCSIMPNSLYKRIKANEKFMKNQPQN